MMQDNRMNAYYLRLSLEDGDVTEGNQDESCSITSQRICVQQFIDTHAELGENYKEFVDDGYSGTNMERPGVQRLLKLVEQGAIRTIIVRDLSRFARNYLEAGHYLEFVFPAYGVRFISINDRYDSEDYGENPAGLDLVIRNLINQMYSKDISKKIKSAVDLKKRSGEFVYGTAPFGYKKGEKKNTIVVDDEAAITVKRIFKLAAGGISITNIACILNKEKIPTPSQHLAAYRSSKYRVYPEWSWNSVKNILENRIYTGDTEPFKSHVVKIGSDLTKQIPAELREIIPETHAPIVSRELYYQAQQTIKSVKKVRKQIPRNPLTSKLVCGCCGNKLQKGKAKNKTWLCVHARYDTSLECKQVRADDAKTQELILRAIQRQCDLTDISLQEQRAVQKVSKSERTLIADELRGVQRKYDKVVTTKQELLEAMMDDKLSRDEYIKRKKKLITEEEELTAQIAVLQNRLEVLSAAAEGAVEQEKTASAIKQHQGITELTPEVMRALVKRVVVYPDNRIHIDWNFSDNILPFVPTGEQN